MHANDKSTARFETIGKLGSGAYGVVLKAKDSERDEVVALKRIHNIPRNPQELATLLQEAIILKGARHPNIVKILDAYQSSSGRVYLVFEHVDKTISRELLFKPQGLPIQQVKLVMWQALQAVLFLHQQGILHRDLKPENILISNEGIVKICDFGFARFTSAYGHDPNSYAITRWYRAPEVLVHVSEQGALSSSDPYGPGVDIWALGCVMAALATGQPLMPGLDRANQLKLITAMVGPLTPEQLHAVEGDDKLSAAFKSQTALEKGQLEQRLHQLPLDAVEVIRDCLQVDPTLRASAKELLQRPFFSDVQVPAELVEQLDAVQATGPSTGQPTRPRVVACEMQRSGSLPATRQHSAECGSNEGSPGLRAAPRHPSLLDKALPTPAPPDPASSAQLLKPARWAPSASAASLIPSDRQSMQKQIRRWPAASPVYRPLLDEVCTSEATAGHCETCIPFAAQLEELPFLVKRCLSVLTNSWDEEAAGFRPSADGLATQRSDHVAAVPIPVTGTRAVSRFKRHETPALPNTAQGSCYSGRSLDQVMGSLGQELEELHCELLHDNAESGFSGVMLVMGDDDRYLSS